MASVKLNLFAFILFFSLPLHILALPLSSSCPFSKSPDITCMCVGAFQNVYSTVMCQLGDVDTLPKFDSNPGQYQVTGSLTIQFEHPVAFYIQSDSFVDFSSIHELALISLNDVLSISWDQQALRGTQIAQFQMTSIFHFNSAFAALTAAEQPYLVKLELDLGGAYHLGGGDLKDFKHLDSITISDTSISTIDQTAFQGLENVLSVIRLNDADVDERLFPALKGLNALKELYLSKNGFKSVDFAVFDGLSELRTVSFDWNDQLEKISISALDKVPSSLTYISLVNSSLKAIPNSFNPLLDRANFEKLDISANTKLICDKNIQWTARYALCAASKLQIQNAQCANLQKKTLESYLKETVPNPCG